MDIKTVANSYIRVI